jgi:hypothetical protein
LKGCIIKEVVKTGDGALRYQHAAVLLFSDAVLLSLLLLFAFISVVAVYNSLIRK